MHATYRIPDAIAKRQRRVARCNSRRETALLVPRAVQTERDASAVAAILLLYCDHLLSVKTEAMLQRKKYGTCVFEVKRSNV